MRHAPLIGIVAAVFLFGSLVSAGSRNARRPRPVPFRVVSIDGLSFHAAAPGWSDAALLRRELERLGVTPPGVTDIPEARLPGTAPFSGKLVGPVPSGSTGATDLPRGWTAEHTIRMSGGGRTVELAFGALPAKPETVSSRLEAAGWVPLSIEAGGAPTRVLRNDRGKEAAFVCLDETDGKFLLFRRVAQ